VARLLESVDLDRTIVVVFGDHGECFGEVPLRPFGHGMDLDLFETHVPLIIAAKGAPAGKVVTTPVGLIDVAATVLTLAGLPGTLGESRDHSPTWASTPPAEGRTWYSEATVPDLERTSGWNNLDTERGVAKDGYLLLRSPFEDNRPRLYRIADRQPAVQDPARTAELDQLLQSWDAKAPPHRDAKMSDATREGLKALGYAE